MSSVELEAWDAPMRPLGSRMLQGAFVFGQVYSLAGHGKKKSIKSTTSPFSLRAGDREDPAEDGGCRKLT